MASFPSSQRNVISICLFHYGLEDSVITAISENVKQSLKKDIEKGLLPQINVEIFNLNKSKLSGYNKNPHNIYKYKSKKRLTVSNNLKPLVEIDRDDLTKLIKNSKITVSQPIDMINPTGIVYPQNQNSFDNEIIRAFNRNTLPVICVDKAYGIVYKIVKRLTRGSCIVENSMGIQAEVFLLEDVKVDNISKTVDYIVDFIKDNFYNSNALFPESLICSK